MRTSLWISLLLLMAMLAGGYLEEAETRRISARYVSAAEELQVMAEKQEWRRAAETAKAYLSAWRDTVPWLQILINHDDIDDVTLTLERIQAAIAAQEQSSCFEACAELRENAGHIFHRDAFALGNVL